MASSTPTRRVLSNLDVNKPTGRGAPQPSKLGVGNLPTPQKLGGVSLQAALKVDVSGAVYQEARLSSSKRDADVFMDAPKPSPCKRQKMGHSPKAAREEGLQDPERGQSLQGGTVNVRVVQSPPSRVGCVQMIKNPRPLANLINLANSGI
jgi:hypothetical protein